MDGIKGRRIEVRIPDDLTRLFTPKRSSQYLLLIGKEDLSVFLCLIGEKHVSSLHRVLLKII